MRIEIRRDDLETWTRDLCTALEKGGRSFVGCLEYATERQGDETFRAVLGGVTGVVALGYPLSRAMALHDDVFDTDYRAVVRCGEMYGELDVALRRYVDHPEDRAPKCKRPG